ncbi:MAG: 2-oxoacid:acceptor oxidoreductase family protein [Candidatus Diapherotrites archaeon]|nr:2-oxoacid:acceptor oxidoreductase family protein [Candidatus Diapherotrites archaeon]
MIKEIVIYGRGGQGAVTSSYVLAKAFFYEGFYSQAFPSFGVERTGAPVEAYVRFSKKPINLRQHVYKADYAIVLDSSLIEAANVKEKLKRNASVFINSAKKRKYFGKDIKEITTDITSISLKIIGKPFVNISILGLFATTKLVTMESLRKAIYEMLPENLAKLNYAAAMEIYKNVVG